MTDGAGPVRHLAPEEIEAIRGEITPIERIPLYRHIRTLFPLEARRCDLRKKILRMDEGR